MVKFWTAVYFGIRILLAPEPEMIKPEHLREEIVRPTLRAMAAFNPKLYSDSAVELIMGTAAQESDLGYYLTQGIDNGGLGIFQIEKSTHDDVKRYLNRPQNQGLLEIVQSIAPDMAEKDLIGNLHYGAAITRVKYWMRPEPLPQTLPGWAGYYKAHFNTHKGKATEQNFIDSYEQFVLGN